MMDQVAYNIIVNVITLAGYVYLASKQFLEMQRLPDSITPLRRLVFTIYLIAIFTVIPVLMYQVTVFQNEPSELLRTISTVLSPTNRLATLALLILLVNYRIKE